VGVNDHRRRGDDDIVGATAGADGSVTVIPEIFNVGEAEQAVAVGAAAGSIGSIGLAVLKVAGHGNEHNTEEKTVASLSAICATNSVE
jgi:2-methylisocitrate lyase-like PEP mutase family enzyme